MIQLRRPLALVGAVLLALVASCVDGRSPTALDVTGTASLSIIPVFSTGPMSVEGEAPINRIRVTARLQSDGSVLATFVVDVDPNASEWDLQLEIPIPQGGGSVILTIELVNVAPGGGETVQWSGRSTPIPLTPGQPTQVQQVPVVRGSPDNLSVTGITLTPDSSRIREGDSVQLTASVTTSDPAARPTVYWASLDTALASVSASGLVQGRLPGTARIVAQAGGPADTARVVVTAVPRGVVITPAEVLLTDPQQEASFTAQVLDSRGNPVAGAQVTWRALDTVMLESLGGGRFRARYSAVGQVEARAVADTSLFATARVLAAFPEADLSLVKSAGVTQATVGDTVTFTVAVTNRGPTPAGAFTVADFAPASLRLLSNSVTVGSASASPLQWQVPGLAVGATATWVLNFLVESGTEPLISNAAEIVSATTSDPDPSNNRSTHQLAVASTADVAVDILATSAGVVRGDSLGLTVRVRNAGPGRARNVRVAVPLPPGLRLRLAQASVGSWDSIAGVWTLGTLEPGASGDFYRSTVAAESGPDVILVVADYARFAPASDPVAANNVDTLAVPVLPSLLDLAVSKRFARDTVLEQDTVRWSVRLVNRGPARAVDVRLADALDAAAFESVAVVRSVRMRSTAPGAAHDTLVVDSLAAGDTALVEFVGRVRPGTAGRRLWNRAAFVRMSPLLTRTNIGDDADSAWVAVKSNASDLEIRKTVNRDSAYVGDTLRYVVTVRNLRGPMARQVVVLDTFDTRDFSAFTVVRRFNGMTGSVPGRLVTDSLAPGDSAVIEVRAVVDTVALGRSVLNRAVITGVQGVRDTITANDAASRSVRIRPHPLDLAIFKGVDNPEPVVGSLVTFTVVVANPSITKSVTDVVVSDRLPAGLTFVSMSPEGAGYDPATGIWQVGVVAPNTQVILLITTQVGMDQAGDTLLNVARLESSNPGDADPNNNEATATVRPRPRTTDLSVTKSVTPTAPFEGDTVTFTVGLANSGPQGVDAVVVSDLLPAGLVYAAHTVSAGSYDAQTGLWSAGSLAAGTSLTLTMRASVAVGTAGQLLTNRAVIVSRQNVDLDPNPANDSTSASVSVQTRGPASVTLTPEGAGMSSLGDTVFFTAIVRDALGNLITDATLTWTVLDAGVLGVGGAAGAPSPPIIAVGNGTTQVTVTATKAGTSASASVPVTVAQVPTSLSVLPADTTLSGLGQTATFTAVARDARLNPIPDALFAWSVSDGTVLSLTAGTGGTAQALSVALGSSLVLVTATRTDVTVEAQANVNVQGVDLRVGQITSNATPAEHQDVNLTVGVKNVGAQVATAVVLDHPLGLGLTFLSNSQRSHGTYESGTGKWTIGTLNPGDSAFIVLQVQANAGTTGQTLAPKASLTASTPTDANPVNDTASVALTVTAVDLARVGMTASTTTPAEHQDVTVTIGVKNTGVSDLTTVRVANPMPAGLRFLSNSQRSHGTYDGATGIWSIGALALNDSAFIVLVVEPVAGTTGQTLANRAQLSMDQTDAVPANDSITRPLTVTAVDLARVGTLVSDPTPTQGDLVDITVGIKNTGVADQTGVVVTDLLPTGLAHSATLQVDRGTLNVETGVWTVGALTANDSVTLLYRTTVTASTGTVLSGWARLDSDQTDADTLNNVGTATITVSNQAPEFAGAAASTNDETPVVITLLATDADGDALNFTVTSGPSVGTVGPVTSTGLQSAEVTYTPALDGLGSQSFTVQVSDGKGGIASALVTVDVSDKPATVVNLALTKSVNAEMADVGDTVIFTLSVSNPIGSGTGVTNVQVFDSLPPGTTFVSATTASGAYADNVWSIPQIPESASVSLAIRAEVTEDAFLSDAWVNNKAYILGSAGISDPVQANDTAYAAFSVWWTDIQVTKTVNKTTPVEGDSVVFTIQAVNPGGDFPADTVEVTDLLPAGLTYIDHVASTGTYNPVTGVWAMGVVDLVPVSLQIRAWVDGGTAGTTLTNAAALTYSRPYDGFNPDNDTASVSLVPRGTDVRVEKYERFERSTVPAGVADSLFYDVLVTNGGPGRITNLVVHDTVPAGTTIANVSVPEGTSYTVAGGVVIWTIPELTGSTERSMTIRADYAALTHNTVLRNRARIVSLDQTDTIPENDVAEVVIAAQQGSLNQENLLGEAIGGQGIGCFDDLSGIGDPTCTTYNYQSGQGFTTSAFQTGYITRIDVPVRNLSSATDPVVLEVYRGAPGGTLAGSVSLGPEAFTGVSLSDPTTWASFDFTAQNIFVTTSDSLSFVVRTNSPIPYNFVVETVDSYTGGTGYRRNAAAGLTWTQLSGSDYGFRFFVVTSAGPS